MALTELGGPEINEEKKGGIFSKVKKVFSKDDTEFNAEGAWLQSTYGEGCNMSLEERIARKQQEIRDLIESKFPSRTGNVSVCCKRNSYMCVINFEEDLVMYKDEILEPFINKGFRIINLSEKVNEIEDDYVYLISWKNIFKSKKN